MSSQSILDDIERSSINRMEAMNRLLVNEDFKLVFIKHYLRDSVNELIMREGVQDSNVGLINSRKNLSDYMFSTIEEGKFALAKKEQ